MLPNALNWFRTYLQNRLYYVEIDNHKSDFTQIGLGVLQGSILGPLLFIIYTNDIQCCSDFFKFIEYAEETTLFNSNVDINNENTLIINKELQNVYKWLCATKLSLNIDKTKYMIFHSAHKNIDHDTFNIKLYNISLENVEY